MSEWLQNEVLARHCSWKIGGPAEHFVAPSSEDELRLALQRAAEMGLPVTVLGAGSNILFADRGVRGLVLQLGRQFGRVQIEGNRLTAEAGAYMPCVARQSMHGGLSGLEHTVGIPGTVGGVAVMNGGSLRRSVGERISWVRAIHRETLQLAEFNAKDCAFAYRQSAFQDGQWIITQLGFVLQPKDHRQIRRDMLQILRERRCKFPLKMPNCGSVFKNDPAVFRRFGAPGRMVEALGFKGRRQGGAMVSERHANFIVNCGHATAADVLRLTYDIKHAIHEHYGVELCEEYQKIGDFT